MTKDALVLAEMFKRQLYTKADYEALRSTYDNELYNTYLTDMREMFRSVKGSYGFVQFVDKHLVDDVPDEYESGHDVVEAYLTFLHIICAYPEMFPCIDDIIRYMVRGLLYASGCRASDDGRTDYESAKYFLCKLLDWEDAFYPLGSYSMMLLGHFTEFLQNNIQLLDILERVKTIYSGFVKQLALLNYVADRCKEMSTDFWPQFFYLFSLPDLSPESKGVLLTRSQCAVTVEEPTLKDVICYILSSNQMGGNT